MQIALFESYDRIFSLCLFVLYHHGRVFLTCAFALQSVFRAAAAAAAAAAGGGAASGGAATLTARLAILDEMTSPPLLAHAAVAEGVRLPYEAVYRSEQALFMDCATAEYEFCRAFFGASHEAVLHVLARSISLQLSHLEAFLLEAYDGVALLLMILIAHGQRRVMQRRRVPCLVRTRASRD